MTIVVNVRRASKSDLSVYIGRPRGGEIAPAAWRWGNPFVLVHESGRNESVARYAAWLAYSDDPRAAWQREQLAAGALTGRELGCFCAPKLCHGHVLARIAESASPATMCLVLGVRALHFLGTGTRLTAPITPEHRAAGARLWELWTDSTVPPDVFEHELAAALDLPKCGHCGANPCYHQCPNSPHYYSPEQERHDEAFYGDDDHRERYAATAEPSQYI